MKDIDPMTLARTMVEMQALDSKVFELHREIEGLPEKYQLGELASELDGAKSELTAKKSEDEELEHRQHKLDGELDLLCKKIKKEEEKLFSGTIMNPKELSSIQAEILSLRKKRDEMETEDLELMEEVDGARGEIERLGSRITDVSSREVRAKGEHEVELADKEAEVRVLEEERDGLKALLDEDLVERYEKLVRDKGGLAVARIEQGRNCGGCHIQFSRTQMDRFQHEEGIFTCEYCRRILVK